MERCPKCGSGGELINGVEYYAAQTGGFVVGLGVGFVASLFMGNHGAHAGREVYVNLTEHTYKEYKCTNPRCGHVWTKY